jgi:hypothetical protein
MERVERPCDGVPVRTGEIEEGHAEGPQRRAEVRQ